MKSHEKRIRIAEQVRRHPERSNREIAKRLGVSHPTVSAVRRELLAGGKIVYHTRPRSRFSPDRHPADFYRTPRWAVETLLDRESFNGSVLEPACGSGTIVEVLSKAGYEVTGSDIRKGNDFLSLATRAENIVTNPPYKQAVEFVEQAKVAARRKIAMLLPLEFLGGQRRYTLYQDRLFPLKVVYVFAERLTFGEGKMFPTAHAWFVWERGCRSKPRVDWIAPK